MRASSFPLLENEPLVIIRNSFLTLCDGDQAAAALLNNFVYWHDWCLQHGRHDQTASLADPAHKPIDPECWFWKTVEDLSRDLLGGWGEKKIRSAAALIEAKGFAVSRPNPINPWDRTKQYRLVVENLHSALSALGPAGAGEAGEKIDDPPVRAKAPTRSGKNAGWAESTTCAGASIRQIDRMDPAKQPALRTEITKSEITDASSSSAETPARSTPLTPRMTNDRADPANADAGAGTHEQPVCEGIDPLASVPPHWAQTRGIRKRNPNGCIGLPSADFATEWAKAARHSDIRNSDELCAVLDHAFSQANEISNKNGTDWEWWSYLTIRVETAARVLAPRLRDWRITSTSEAPTTNSQTDGGDEPIMPVSAERARVMEEFSAWWSRLSGERRNGYGSVCDPRAMQDFERFRRLSLGRAESCDSLGDSAATRFESGGEQQREADSALVHCRLAPSQPSPTAPAGECSLQSHSVEIRNVTRGDASNA
jgi:hypothetical protein